MDDVVYLVRRSCSLDYEGDSYTDAVCASDSAARKFISEQYPSAKHCKNKFGEWWTIDNYNEATIEAWSVFK